MNELYNKILENNRRERKRLGRVPQKPRESVSSRENDDDVFSYDFESQSTLWESYNYEAYVRSQSSKSKKMRAAKIALTLELSEVRETQWVDCRLAEILKSKLHILLSINENGNNNSLNGKNFIPANQLVVVISLGEV